MIYIFIYQCHFCRSLNSTFLENQFEFLRSEFISKKKKCWAARNNKHNKKPNLTHAKKLCQNKLITNCNHLLYFVGFFSCWVVRCSSTLSLSFAATRTGKIAGQHFIFIMSGNWIELEKFLAWAIFWHSFFIIRSLSLCICLRLFIPLSAARRVNEWVCMRIYLIWLCAKPLWLKLLLDLQCTIHDK